MSADPRGASAPDPRGTPAPARPAAPAGGNPGDANPERQHDPVAYTLLVVMAACFAGTWVAARWATDEVPPLTVAFLRFVVASALLWGWARLSGIAVGVTRRDLGLVVALGLTGTVGYNIFFLNGVRLAPSSDGAIIVPGLSPVVATLVVALRYGTYPPRRGLVGLGLAIAGLVVVIGPVLGTDPERAAGDLLYVGGAACWGAYSVVSRSATGRFHPVAATLLATLVGAVAFAPLALLEGGWAPLLEAGTRSLASIGYLGAVGTVVAFVAFSEAIRRIGAPRASAFIVLVPLLGEILAFWLLGEPIGGFIVVGTALVLGGLWLVQTARPTAITRREPAAAGAAPIAGGPGA